MVSRFSQTHSPRLSETNLDEVLQSRNVFSNVSKGELAKTDKVTRAFGAADADAILEEILSRGDLQVGEKERELALSKMRREVALSLAGMSVNPTNNMPYPVTMLEKAMKDVHFKPDPRKAAKKQAKALIRVLAEKMPLVRAKMRLKISGGSEAALEAMQTELEWEEESRGEGERMILLEPDRYRAADALAKDQGAQLVIVSLAATAANAPRGGEEVVAVDLAQLRLDEDEDEEEEGEGKHAKDEEPAQHETKTKKGSKKQLTKRAEKGLHRDELMGVVEDDSDDDWKKGTKKKGKGKGKRK
jgi:ribosome maturation protein SDO1